MTGVVVVDVPVDTAVMRIVRPGHGRRRCAHAHCRAVRSRLDETKGAALMSASVPDEERVQPRGTRNEKRWAAVIDAAEQVFLERGYQAASLKEIANRVGMLKGSLYYYIDTKEDLLFEIVRRAHQSGLEFAREKNDEA